MQRKLAQRDGRRLGLFVLYIVLGHRLAEEGGGEGIDRLGAAMLVAAVVTAPIGFADAVPAFGNPIFLLAAIGVGVSSSVIPYVTDSSRWRGCRAGHSR
jgi:inner membrane transporter RhtA